MNRREFLKVSGTLGVAGALPGLLGGCAGAVFGAGATAGRLHDVARVEGLAGVRRAARRARRPHGAILWLQPARAVSHRHRLFYENEY